MQANEKMQEQQPQQQHQTPVQQTQVIVVQQPVMYERRRNQWYKDHKYSPYLSRGAKCGDCWCRGIVIIYMGLAGAFCVAMGSVLAFTTAGSLSTFGTVVIITGVILVGACLRLCHVAHRDFNALPENHPDRLKYTRDATSSAPMAMYSSQAAHLPPNAVALLPTTAGQPHSPTTNLQPIASWTQSHHITGAEAPYPAGVRYENAPPVVVPAGASAAYPGSYMVSLPVVGSCGVRPPMTGTPVTTMTGATATATSTAAEIHSPGTTNVPLRQYYEDDLPPSYEDIMRAAKS